MNAIRRIGIPVSYSEEGRYHTYLSWDDIAKFKKWGAVKGYHIACYLCECGAAENHERAVIVPVNP